MGYSVSCEGIASDPKYAEKIKKNAIAPTNNKQLESILGLAKFYGRMIPDFATKMLPNINNINNMRNNDFSWGKMQQKSFEDIKKKNYVLTQ